MASFRRIMCKNIFRIVLIVRHGDGKSNIEQLKKEKLPNINVAKKPKSHYNVVDENKYFNKSSRRTLTNLAKSERVDEENEENDEKVSRKEDIKTINDPKVVPNDKEISHSNKRNLKSSRNCRCEIF